ncbi:Peptidyl-alpha-hydroxyglycine alpha-amidating lyase 1 [Gossypium arboreum]|uniref:Peptidyl-alpha-hydroxyglycine alpha-amidating lyase 1 n=1 Tax=Gossypium arboreum TaxID=29729 RepID=A0A0B0N046_GOSAR|nr:Peptidyl-alpha-hydroxyglycine alpha-amidating lyase 1 [Gossypium arboreum]
MCISVPSRNNFIFILIVSIPNEPLRIIISATRETLRTKCHISINGTAHTSYQSRRSYTVLLTQVVK